MDENCLVLSPGNDTIYWAVKRVAVDGFIFVGGTVDLWHDLEVFYVVTFELVSLPSWLTGTEALSQVSA